MHRAQSPGPTSLVAMAAAVCLLAPSTSAGQAANASVAGSPSTLSHALAEANRDFTHGGRPINPRAVHDLLPWLSDALPGPVAIDVEGAQQANRYSGDVEKGERGLVRLIVEARPGQRVETYDYVRVGTLTGGMHVLRAAANMGGSGTFVSLLIVRFSIEREFQDEEWRARLVMTRVAEVSLGDRYGGEISVSGRTVSIGADRRSGTKARTIRF